MAHWEIGQTRLEIYRYVEPDRPSGSGGPVLLLHDLGTATQTWDQLAFKLWIDGFMPIFATALPDSYRVGISAVVTHLQDVVEWVLEQEHPRMLLVTHGLAGVVAHRYVRAVNGRVTVPLLLTIGCPYPAPVFEVWQRMGIYVTGGPDESPTNPPLSDDLRAPTDTEPFTQTALLNLYGDAFGRGFDGVVQAVALPEAVNIPLPLTYNALLEEPEVYDQVHSFLYGQRNIIRLYLRSLKMADPAGKPVGPFCLEIEDYRVPCQGAFQVEAGHVYSFDMVNQPLLTLAYPVSQTAADIRVHLKEQTPSERRLMATLHVPLVNSGTSRHVMPDTAGSEIQLDVHCAHLSRLVPAGT